MSSAKPPPVSPGQLVTREVAAAVVSAGGRVRPHYGSARERAQGEPGAFYVLEAPANSEPADG